MSSKASRRTRRSSWDKHFEKLENRQLFAGVDVLTQHNDLNRSGDNLSETTLTPSNVNTSTFGRLYSRSVDDQVYAQPLVATNISIAGATHNVLFIATVNDSVYAFDADNPSITTPYWQGSMFSTAHGAAAGARPVFHTDVGQNCGTYADFSGNIGIVGTPVIDKASNTIYLVARTVEGGAFVQRIHALDLSTGAEKFGGPVVISASVTGTGDGASGGKVAFNPQTENQRDGLALSNGNLYIGWASHCDTGPYHGWFMAYDAATLAQKWVFNTTPNGSEGGIWMSGAAPSIDSSGNIYFSCGNGSVSTGSSNYGEGILKLSSSGALLDYFIPSNWSNLNNIDADFGSSGDLLVPGTNTLVTGDKEGRFFIANTGNLTHLNSTDQITQEFQVTPSVNNDHIHGAPIYFKDGAGNNWVYVWGMDDQLKQFLFNPVTGKFDSTTPTFTGNPTIAPTPSQPGGLLSLSANGTSNGILWSMSTLGPSANQAVQPGILRAFDATNVTTELWNSQQNASRDDFGNLAKFSDATIANGHVYTPTFSNQVVVYGLLAGRLAAPASLTATPVAGQNEIDLSWAAVTGAANYTVERSIGSGVYSTIATLPAGTVSFADTTVNPGTTYNYRVRARNTVGDSDPVTATAATSFVKQLVAWWRLDDKTTGTGGTAADSSGNGNTGTVGANATWSSSGRIVDALSFTSSSNAYTNSDVQIPDSVSLDPTAQITLSGWVNAKDWTGNHRLIQKGGSDNQYRLLVETNVLKLDLSGIGSAGQNGNSLVLTASLPSTLTWHLITGTFDGTTARLYVDGVQVTSGVATGTTLSTTTDPLFIGAKTAGGTNTDHMNGKIDDVRIYNYALSAVDVASLYTTSIPAAPSGLALLPSSPSSVNISWTDNSTNETGFYLERKTGSTGTYAVIATLAAGATSFIDTNLTASTTYFYRIRAFNINDASAYATEQQTTTLATAINALVADWKLNETTGTTAADSSSYNNPGTLVGSPVHTTDTPDHSAAALSFNGTTQYVQVANSFYLQPTSTVSLGAWVKAADWSGTRGIIAKGDREGAYYLIADGGVLKFNLSGQGTLTAPLPSLNVWHYVAGTYDGATMKIFVDGLMVSSMAATGALLTSNDPLFIGGTGASAATGQAFSGLIDEPRVYNYAIIPRDVSALYGNAGQWTFDGSTTADSTPNGNTLTLAGSPTTVPGVVGSALSLNGTTQYASANNNQVLNPTSAISLMAWVNASDWSNSPRILAKGNGTSYSLMVSGGQLQLVLTGVGTLSTSIPAAGTWHHLAGTYNGATMVLYIDGVAVASKSATGSIATSTDNLNIGAATTLNGSVVSIVAGTTLHGSVDDARVFSRGLTAPEIQAIAGTSLVLTGTTNYIKLDADGIHVDVFANSAGTGTPSQSVLLSNTPFITVSGAAAASSLTVDFSSGLPLPPTGLTVNGGAGGLSLKIIGTSAADTVNVQSSAVTVNGSVITTSGVTSVAVTGAGGADVVTQSSATPSLLLTDPTSLDTLNVSAGSYSFGPSTGTGVSAINLGTLNVASGATVSVPAASVYANHRVLVVSSLIVNGTLNLASNDLMVVGGDPVALAVELNPAGTTGIISTTAANDPANLTTLGLILNNDGSGSRVYGSGTSLGLFDGQNPAATDVLIKYTYFGDANLDGTVDGSDYTKIDNGFNNNLTGWLNGDFNADGVVDGSDYTLIDNAFNTQSGVLAPAATLNLIAAPTRSIAVAPSVLSKPVKFGTKPIANVAFSDRQTTSTGIVLDEWMKKVATKKAVDVA